MFNIYFNYFYIRRFIAFYKKIMDFFYRFCRMFEYIFI